MKINNKLTYTEVLLNLREQDLCVYDLKLYNIYIYIYMKIVLKIRMKT